MGRVDPARRAGGGRRSALAEVARAGGAGTLAAEATRHDTDHMAYPYGVHLAVVRVDRDTGAVAVERYLRRLRCRARGQSDAGRGPDRRRLRAGTGRRARRGVRATTHSGQPLSVTLADYLMPTACETPQVEVLLLEDAPSPLNPLGLKGAGEGGINAVGAAIAAAIDDAIGVPGAVTALPVTPQRVLEMIAGRLAKGTRG